MATYKINDGWDDARVVEADGFTTVGEFVDFSAYKNGMDMTVLRVRVERVQSIELVSIP